MTHTRTVLAFVAATLAATASVHADQKKVGYKIYSGSCGDPIPVPANNTPVIMAGANIEPSDSGVGQVTILRQPQGRDGAFLQWVGTDYYAGAERGKSNAPLTTIMYLDQERMVPVIITDSTHVEVCVASSYPFSYANGFLTFTY